MLVEKDELLAHRLNVVGWAAILQIPIFNEIQDVLCSGNCMATAVQASFGGIAGDDDSSFGG
jgi:hypothetical protein